MSFWAKYKRIIIALFFIMTCIVAYQYFFKDSEIRIISKMVTKKPLPVLKYGFNIRDYKTEIAKVSSDDVFGSIMSRYGFSGNIIQRMIDASESTLNLKKIIKGNEYVFLSESNTDSTIPKYFVYEKNMM